MFSKNFWEKCETWEKVMLYILVLPLIILRICFYLFLTVTELIYKGLCIAVQFLWPYFLEYFWLFVHKTKKVFKACVAFFKWFEDVGRNKQKQKVLKRIACAVLFVVFSFSLLLSCIYLRNYIDEKEAKDAMEHVFYSTHHVSYGDSWWSIAKEHCPEYMYVSSSDTSVCNYLNLLYSVNDGGFDLYPGMEVVIPCFPD